MLSDDELADLRRFHERSQRGNWCLLCQFEWPCDATRLLDEVDRLRGMLDRPAFLEPAPTLEPHLWITPTRRSGDVCIGGLNVRAEIVAERVWVEGVEVAMAEWDISREVVLLACWWWIRNPSEESYVRAIPVHGHRNEALCRWCDWLRWADDYIHAMYGNPAPWPRDEIPDPPEKP